MNPCELEFVLALGSLAPSNPCKIVSGSVVCPSKLDDKLNPEHKGKSNYRDLDWSSSPNSNLANSWTNPSVTSNSGPFTDLDTTIQTGFVIDAFGLTYGAAFENLSNLIATTAKLQPPGNPKRLFGTYHCGPGGAGSTAGNINGPCSTHDTCFKNAGATFQNWVTYQTGGGGDPSLISAMQSCNQQLCSSVNNSAATFSEAGQAFLINQYFGCTP